MEVVILANGLFPKTKRLLDILDSADKIICCDGAVNKLLERGRVPSVIIGDLDSVDKEIKVQYADILVPIADQNTNDLTKAVMWCKENGITKVKILGATGEREDHTLANISLLAHYKQFLEVNLFTDYGVFIPITESRSFPSFRGQQVSIFSLTPDVEVNSQGLKYPLQNKKLTQWWMGTLNEATGNSFSIRFDGRANFIIYLLNKDIDD